MPKLLMLDLFSGLGGASAAMRQSPRWDVVTVDCEPRFAPTVTADLRTWSWKGPRPFLVWASPPCTEFSREIMPWCRTGKPPSLDLVIAARRIVRECDPSFWVVENVRGAIRWVAPVLGAPAQSCGPFFLWGRFPRFRLRVRPFKEHLSSTRKAERAMIPGALSEALRAACESTFEALTFKEKSS